MESDIKADANEMKKCVSRCTACCHAVNSVCGYAFTLETPNAKLEGDDIWSDASCRGVPELGQAKNKDPVEVLDTAPVEKPANRRRRRHH